jgi:DNA-binding transcriptional regulator YbjK
MFDAITPAVVAADLTVGYLLNETRAARLVQQRALDSTLPGLDTVIDQLLSSTFVAESANAYESEISRAVQRVVIEHLMTLASNADMPQVRAIATHKLQQRQQRLSSLAPPSEASSAHAALLVADIKRFLDRPLAPATRAEIPTAPPGAPIGEPALNWLGRPEPLCTWWEE